MERIEDDWGAWGALYRDDDGRLLGSIQYGPATLFPRAAELPAGPPSDDAVLVTCVYVVSTSTPWVEQSLFLAAIGEARDKGAKALEAFAYRYPEGESTYERFLVHRTVFPRDFLADFGFASVRAQGRVELSRLELGGLVPVVEGKRAAVLRVRQGGLRAGAGAAAALTAPPSRRGRRLADVSRSHLRQHKTHISNATRPTLARPCSCRGCSPPRRRDARPPSVRCRTVSPTRSSRTSGARRRWRSRRMAGCSSRRSSARCGSSRTASLLPTPSLDLAGDALHRERDGAARRGGRPRVRGERLRLSLLHAEQDRQLRQPRLALHDERERRSRRRPSSVLVDEIPATSGNHNGGDLRFGNDGYLYVSVGDGGCDYAATAVATGRTTRRATSTR